MEICLNNFDSVTKYDDGVAVDYAFMIRMWSAFDRSIDAFERRCGLPALDPRGKEAYKPREEAIN